MLKKSISALALGFSLSGPVLAGIPLVTDDTGTQGSGGNQLEFAFTRAKDPADNVGRELAIVYTRGLTDTLDVFIEKGRQTVEPATGGSSSGLGNTVIGAKWRVWENERKTSLALKGALALPLSSDQETEGWGTGKVSYDALLILAQEMSWGSVNANVGMASEKFRSSANNADSTHVSVAPIFNLTEQLKLAIDLGFDRTKTDAGTEKTRYGEIGLMYSPSETIDLGLGFIRTTDEDSKDVTNIVTGGLTWRFK